MSSTIVLELSFRHYNLPGSAGQIALSLIHNVKDRSHHLAAMEIVLNQGQASAELLTPSIVHGIYPLPKRPMAARREWWAWVDSNYRPHAYQACALTT